MIQEFIQSWGLFHNSWLAGWLLAVLLSMTGVLVVAKDQIFLGAAVAEASTLGVALGMWLTSVGPFHGVEWMESDLFLSLLAGASSVAATLLTSRSGRWGRESTEAVTGWVFLAAASFAILLVSHSPHGTEEIHRLLSSSIIGSSSEEVTFLAIATFCVGCSLLYFRRRILLVLTDPDMAQASGVPARAWELFTCGLLGTTVGYSLRVSGMLYTFGCLVLPALSARSFSRTASGVFVAAPILAILTTFVAFVLANHWDYPPGQTAVAALSCITAASFILRRLRKR